MSRFGIKKRSMIWSWTIFHLLLYYYDQGEKGISTLKGHENAIREKMKIPVETTPGGRSLIRFAACFLRNMPVTMTGGSMSTGRYMKHRSACSGTQCCHPGVVSKWEWAQADFAVPARHRVRHRPVSRTSEDGEEPWR